MLQLFNSLKIQRLQLDLEGFKGFVAKARIIGVGASREFSGFELLESERANGTGYELRSYDRNTCTRTGARSSSDQATVSALPEPTDTAPPDFQTLPAMQHHTRRRQRLYHEQLLK